MLTVAQVLSNSLPPSILELGHSLNMITRSILAYFQANAKVFAMCLPVHVKYMHVSHYHNTSKSLM